MPDPIRFWNVPFTYVEQMPYSLTNLATVGVYGNLKHYLLGRRKGIGSFFVNPYTYDISEQTRISLATRWAGRPAYGKAFVELKY
jgi:HK97 family phage major capsid protein